MLSSNPFRDSKQRVAIHRASLCRRRLATLMVISKGGKKKDGTVMIWPVNNPLLTLAMFKRSVMHGILSFHSVSRYIRSRIKYAGEIVLEPGRGTLSSGKAWIGHEQWRNKKGHLRTVSRSGLCHNVECPRGGHRTPGCSAYRWLWILTCLHSERAPRRDRTRLGDEFDATCHSRGLVNDAALRELPVLTVTSS